MSTQIVSVTKQAAIFSILSTTLAQSITSWRNQKLDFDLTSLISFMCIAVIVTPPNFLYQKFLEDSFPTKVPASNAKQEDRGKSKQVPAERLSKSNTLAKFCLDQSFGAMANTILFIVLIGLFKGKSLATINSDVHRDFLPMLLSSWRVWPMVTLLNLLVVPFDYRSIVGNAVGVMWGVSWKHLSVFAFLATGR